jgi:nucleoside-diphosphate-sugar epimerase
MSEKIKYNRVMVTGGSGYIASWIVRQLLESGVSVNATVRSLEAKTKISHLEDMRDEFPGQLELFEADLGIIGSFDRAALGCDALIHCASPFFISDISDPNEELIRPAKGGTINVLQAATRSGSVTRVVLTSSVAAIHTDNIDWQRKASGMLDEADWNTTASEKYQPYSYSKTLAEQAAWEYAKGQDQFTLVAVNPSFVIGPSLSTRSDSTSVGTIARFFSGELKIGVPDLRFGMVDVRDVAGAHILALENQEAEGRFILMSESLGFPLVAEILRERYGKAVQAGTRTLPKFLFYLIGPFLGFSWGYTKKNYAVPVKLDTSRSRNILGLEYRPVRDSILEHAQKIIDDGLVSL